MNGVTCEKGRPSLMRVKADNFFSLYLRTKALPIGRFERLEEKQAKPRKNI